MDAIQLSYGSKDAEVVPSGVIVNPSVDPYPVPRSEIPSVSEYFLPLRLPSIFFTILEAEVISAVEILLKIHYIPA